MDWIDFFCEMKLVGDGAAEGTIEGYASVFGLLDRGGDTVMPGAFKASLSTWRKEKSLPPMLWQHNPNAPIGVWTEIAEDDKGLKVKGELILEIAQAANVRALMRKGAVKGLSIGFRTQDSEIDRTTGARRLKKVDLWEISVVTFPMQPEAQASVKGMTEFDPHAWERAFRDEGLSIREAKLATSVARKLSLRDGGKSEPASRDGAADVLLALRKASEVMRS